MEDERKQTIRTIKECLMDYVGPIYICGKVFDLSADSLTIIHATMPKEDLLILNNRYPEWVQRVKNNSMSKNILLIKDFDKISYDDQRMFIELVCKNSISSEKLPSNLKIIINS